MNYELIVKCLDLAGDSVIITKADPIDGSGPEIVYVNDTFCDLTGYSREEAIGRTPRMLQGPKTSRETLNFVKNALIEKESIQVELINYTKDGEEFWVELSISPVKSEEGDFFISIQKDITSIKQKELSILELQESAINSFHEINFHDLKAPIKNIHSFSQLLQRKMADTADETAQEYMEYILKSTSYLSHMVNDIQDLIKYNSSNDSIDRVSVSEIVTAVCSIMKKQIDDSGAQVNLSGDTILEGNRIQLIRVFQNLIENSLKFTRRAQNPTIGIYVDEDDKHQIIRYEDNGEGFSADFKDRAFHLFAKSNLHVDEGSGIGLAIVKSVITGMNGSIRISDPIHSTQGAAFIMKFQKDLYSDTEIYSSSRSKK